MNCILLYFASEIKLVRKYQKVLPDLKFYYLGFYIHNCPKMRYKVLFQLIIM